MSFSGVFVIGLLVPSDAPVFVGGEAVHGVAASPFVYGSSASYYHEVLNTNIIHSSSRQSPGHRGTGSRHQCIDARFHRLNGEHSCVHCVANFVRTGTPGSSTKNLQKSNEARGPPPGATCLLGLQLRRLHEFRRGTTKWYDGYSPFWSSHWRSRTVFTHLVNVTVTFSGITWSTSLFSFIMALVAESVIVCIIYTHIRFMKGNCGA